MTERRGAVTFKGKPLTLVGEVPAVGSIGPDCTLVGNDLAEVTLSSLSGKVRVIVTVPSLDTPVCDLEARRFNAAAAELGEQVVVLVVSMDLPFAQKRWCGAAGAERVVTLSDHRHGELGRAYGVLIKELALLARAVFVLDAVGKVRYVQVVEEMTHEPDYDEVLRAVRELCP